MSQREEMVREAHRSLIRRRGPDAGIVVRRETVRGFALADGLLDAWQTGQIGTAGVPVTTAGPEGEGQMLFMLGASALGGADVLE